MRSNRLLCSLAGRHLKQLRKKSGYTASEFASLVGRSEQQIFRYETGVNKLDIDTLLISLHVLDIDVGNFFVQLSKEAMEMKLFNRETKI